MAPSIDQIVARNKIYKERSVAAQWEEILKKYTQEHDIVCQSLTAPPPRTSYMRRMFSTGSEYIGGVSVFGMTGKGTYVFPNGVVYKGEFSEGAFHGWGELQYPSGEVLQGLWRDGVMVQRTLIFKDGLEYREKGWKYCKFPDRRFAVEYRTGLRAAGETWRTAERPARAVPPGCYDAGDGFYDPRRHVVFHYDDPNHIIRSLTGAEQAWTAAHCRREPPAAGRAPYEAWPPPQLTALRDPPPAVPWHRMVKSEHPGHQTTEEKFVYDVVKKD